MSPIWLERYSIWGRCYLDQQTIVSHIMSKLILLYQAIWTLKWLVIMELATGLAILAMWSCESTSLGIESCLTNVKVVLFISYSGKQPVFIRTRSFDSVTSNLKLGILFHQPDEHDIPHDFSSQNIIGFCDHLLSEMISAKLWQIILEVLCQFHSAHRTINVPVHVKNSVQFK